VVGREGSQDDVIDYDNDYDNDHDNDRGGG
jgi:hypothetical protein